MVKKARRSRARPEPLEYNLTPDFVKDRFEARGEAAQLVGLIDVLISTWLETADGDLGWLAGLSAPDARECVYTLLEHGLVDVAIRDGDDGVGIKITPIVPSGMTEAEAVARMRSLLS